MTENDGFDKKVYNNGTLDNKLDGSTQTEIETHGDAFGGYTLKDHENVINEFNKRKRNEKNVDKPFGELVYERNKELVIDNNIPVNPVLKSLDDVFHKYGLNPKWNIYGKAIKKDLELATQDYETAVKAVENHDSILEGKARYIPMTNPNMEEYRKRPIVREKDKGLRYKKEEIFDELQIIYLNYQQGDILKKNFENQRDTYATTISELVKNVNPANRAQILDLNASKSVLEADLRTLNAKQQDYQNVMRELEGEMDSVNADIKFEEKLIRGSKNKLINERAVIYGLKRHISNNEKAASYGDLIEKIKKLDKRTEMYIPALLKMDEDFESDMQQLESTFATEGPLKRPVLDRINSQNLEDAVGDQELVSRIGKKLGYVSF